MPSASRVEWREDLPPPRAETALADLSVVVLSYNRREELVRNLTLLCEAQRLSGFELIVVDNASSDGTREEIERLQATYHALKVVLSDENFGVARGRNLGWRASRGEFILNLDDDTRIDVASMAALRAAASRTPTAGVVTPRVLHAITGQSQNGYGDHLIEPANFHGACHLVRRQTWLAVGDIDPQCSFGGEELDYSIRARALGLLTRIITLHVASAASAKDFGVIPSLFINAARGARSGRRDYKALPTAALSFYMSATLEPDFGNVPLSAKLSAMLSKNRGAKVTPVSAVCVQYGCGLSTAPGWNNYDASPTLYLQRLPIVGGVFRRALRPLFPADARPGDVLKRLPHADSSVDLVYCSHVLEHVCLQDLRIALRETHRILREGGVFRGVLPDLELEARQYLSSDAPDACSRFMQITALGQETRSRGPKGFLRDWLGNSRHLWMWDFRGLSQELTRAGFTDIRRARFGDHSHDAFSKVEQRDRWDGCLGFECRK